MNRRDGCYSFEGTEIWSEHPFWFGFRDREERKPEMVAKR